MTRLSEELRERNLEKKLKIENGKLTKSKLRVEN